MTNIATEYNPNWGQSGFCCVNPAFNPGTGEFSVQIQTESGAVYELLKSTSLLDHSWWPVAEAWGDGEPQTLKDTEATGTKGFYRVIRR